MKNAAALAIAAALVGCGTEWSCPTTTTLATCGDGNAARDYAICGVPRLRIERIGDDGTPNCGIAAEAAMCRNGDPYCTGGGEPTCFAAPEISAEACLDLMLECERMFGPGSRCEASVSSDGPGADFVAL